MRKGESVRRCSPPGRSGDERATFCFQARTSKLVVLLVSSRQGTLRAFDVDRFGGRREKVLRQVKKDARVAANDATASEIRTRRPIKKSPHARTKCREPRTGGTRILGAHPVQKQFYFRNSLSSQPIMVVMIER